MSTEVQPPSADADAHIALEDLLRSLFSSESLRVFLRRLAGGADVVDELPELLSFAELASRTVSLLARRGLVDAGLFQALRGRFPRRGRDIEAVAARWGCAPGPADATPRAPGPASRRWRIGVALAVVALAVVATRAVLRALAPTDVRTEYAMYKHDALARLRVEYAATPGSRPIVRLGRELTASRGGAAGLDGWSAFEAIHDRASAATTRDQSYYFMEIRNSGADVAPDVFVALEGDAEPLRLRNLAAGELRLVPVKASGMYANLARTQERRVTAVWLDRGWWREYLDIPAAASLEYLAWRQTEPGVYRGYPPE